MINYLKISGDNLMKRTKLSLMISKINYFIAALVNLGKETNTYKFLFKVWMLSSFAMFLTSLIILSNIGTLVTDTISIKLIIYASLFGISLIIPSLFLGILYYFSLFIEQVNLFFNFLYLLLVREILIEKIIRIIFLKIRREFIFSNKEIENLNKFSKSFIDVGLSYFSILLNLFKDRFKHTSNLFFIFIFLTNFIVSTIVYFYLNSFGLAETYIMLISILSTLFHSVLFIFVLLTMFIVLKTLKFINIFFTNMIKEFNASKIEIKEYIENKMKNY